MELKTGGAIGVSPSSFRNINHNARLTVDFNGKNYKEGSHSAELAVEPEDRDHP